jgi:hypothetical protein
MKINYSYTMDVPGERPSCVTVSKAEGTMEELLYAISYNSQLPGARIWNVKYEVVDAQQAVANQMQDPAFAAAMDRYYEQRWAHRFD